MVHFKQSILALTLATSPLGVVSFVPIASPSTITSRPTTLYASNNNNDNVDGKKQIIGSATAFLTGLVVATQVAFADPSTLIDNTYINTAGKKKIKQKNQTMEL